jgi:hypothetical protein
LANLRKDVGGAGSDGVLTVWIRWEGADKYGGGDFGGKSEDGVFVGVETRLEALPLKPGIGESYLQCQDARI